MCVISIDTMKPEVMRAAVAAGAGLVNDVLALQAPGALRGGGGNRRRRVPDAHAGHAAAPCRQDPHYDDVVSEVGASCCSGRRPASTRGHRRATASCSIRDSASARPCSTTCSCWRGLPRLAAANYPLLVGLSRKSMLGKLLGRPVEQRLAGSLALATIAVLHGARIMRCHDVAETWMPSRVAWAVTQRRGLKRMARKYFGTDGVRGRVGDAPMTVDFTLRLASAAARVLAPDGGKALIGKDTRVSGYMFESALEAGFVAAGVDVLLTGPHAHAGHRLSDAAQCRVPSASSSAPRTIRTKTTASSSSMRSGGKLSDELEERIEAGDGTRRAHAALQSPGSRAARRCPARGVPGVLRVDACRAASTSRA